MTVHLQDSLTQVSTGLTSRLKLMLLSFSCRLFLHSQCSMNCYDWYNFPLTWHDWHHKPVQKEAIRSSQKTSGHQHRAHPGSRTSRAARTAPTSGSSIQNACGVERVACYATVTSRKGDINGIWMRISGFYNDRWLGDFLPCRALVSMPSMPHFFKCPISNGH